MKCLVLVRVPCWGGMNLLWQLQLPGVVHLKVEEQHQRPEGSAPGPQAATGTADHHQQAQIRRGSAARALHSASWQAQRWGQTSPQDRKSRCPWWRSGIRVHRPLQRQGFNRSRKIPQAEEQPARMPQPLSP